MKHSKCENISTILKENTTLKKVKKEQNKLEIDFISRKRVKIPYFESLILAQD